MENIIAVPYQGGFNDLPHPLLRPYISQYTYRCIDLPAYGYMEKIMPLRVVNSIDFFIGDSFETLDCYSNESLPFIRCTIRGPRTCKKYLIRLRGRFVSFTIKFRPTGLYRLLGIPMAHFTDKAVPGNDIDSLPFDEITEQLQNAHDIKTCIDIVEPYLLRILSKNNTIGDRTEMAAEYLLQQNGLLSIKQLATDSNISTRQLERNFIKEVGLGPKAYARMLRFQHLLRCKMADPDKKWAALAYDSDYFDQMHLIKEFKQFLGTTPSAFIASDYAF